MRVTTEGATTFEHQEEGAGTEGDSLVSESDILEGLEENEASDAASEGASVEEVQDNEEETVTTNDVIDESAAEADVEVEENKEAEAEIKNDLVLEEVPASSKVYTAHADDVNKGIIASGNNNMLFVVTFENVELKAGANKIDIGGADGDWCLDYVKMAIIRSGEEGELPEGGDFLHGDHIRRSDSIVPGYATDVTRINLAKHDAQYYETNFARADFDCGFA